MYIHLIYKLYTHISPNAYNLCKNYRFDIVISSQEKLGWMHRCSSRRGFSKINQSQTTKWFAWKKMSSLLFTNFGKRYKVHLHRLQKTGFRITLWHFIARIFVKSVTSKHRHHFLLSIQLWNSFGVKKTIHSYIKAYISQHAHNNDCFHQVNSLVFKAKVNNQAYIWVYTVQNKNCITTVLHT